MVIAIPKATKKQVDDKKSVDTTNVVDDVSDNIDIKPRFPTNVYIKCPKCSNELTSEADIDILYERSYGAEIEITDWISSPIRVEGKLKCPECGYIMTLVSTGFLESVRVIR